MSERKTIVKVHLNASKMRVYQTLLDKNLFAKWKVPDDMKCIVHEYHAIENGTFRISLEYTDISEMGKTYQNIDTYHGYFQKLRPFDEIIEIDEFESERKDMQGIMTITYTLIESNGETDLTIVHDNLPIGVSLEDNMLGWELALNKLTGLIDKVKYCMLLE